jgi:hypothetical protein
MGVAAGSAALASSTGALLIIWLLLTKPVDMATAASGRHVALVIELVATALYDVVVRLLQYL